MSTVNLIDAGAGLAHLVERAAKGEEITILKDGNPVARLVPLESRQKHRPIGLGAGRFHIPDDFDKLGSAEIIRLFEGAPE